MATKDKEQIREHLRSLAVLAVEAQELVGTMETDDKFDDTLDLIEHDSGSIRRLVEKIRRES
jgi:hypothetical protein